MNQNTSLQIFTRASLMLAEADTIQKAKELKSLALTAADWAKRKGMGEAAIQHCRSYALEAERKMGQMLAATDRAKPPSGKGQKKTDRRSRASSDGQPTLKEIGISDNESSAAQTLAALPRAVFDQVRNGEKTRTEVAREIKRSEVVKRVAKIPEGKFRVLYADPPWKYGSTFAASDDLAGLAAENNYGTMSIAELCALPVEQSAADDAVLFLWVTSPLLAECWPVIKAWSFTYKASFVWDKGGGMPGNYNHVRHELLLICTRGSCVPDVATRPPSVQSVKRQGVHSAKPEHFRELIQTLYPHGPRLELFARTKSKGWAVFGNEV
jgi:N6-adenosine-specific RNA methylase IME4